MHFATVRRATFVIMSAATFIAACSGGESISPLERARDNAGGAGGGGTSTATTTSSTSSGQTSAGSGGTALPEYPAAHPSMPQIPDNGGVVLHDPVIVSVTFPNDSLESTIDSFGDGIGATDWWKAVHADYGVGPATSGGHVTMADAPPATMTDSDIETWLDAKISDGTLPAPTDQSIYIVYYPDSTSISLPGNGSSCTDFAGYHYFAPVHSGGSVIDVAYAVIPRCGGTKDDITQAASHELTEAATDPHPDFGTAAYTILKKNAWAIFGGEDADMCELVSGVTEGDWQVTRVWSNANAKVGQQPCIPVPPDSSNLPYYNAAIVDEMLSASPGGSVSTKVECYSFAELPNALKLDGQSFSKQLTFEFDQPTCKNGDVVTMTIHVGSAATKGKDYHYELLAQLSDSSAHLWRGMVSVH